MLSESNLSFAGCDGNGNNFKTIEECETRCQANVPGQSGPGEPDRPGQTVGGPGVGLRSSENRKFLERDKPRTIFRVCSD